MPSKLRQLLQKIINNPLNVKRYSTEYTRTRRLGGFFGERPKTEYPFTSEMWQEFVNIFKSPDIQSLYPCVRIPIPIKVDPVDFHYSFVDFLKKHCDKADDIMLTKAVAKAADIFLEKHPNSFFHELMMSHQLRETLKLSTSDNYASEMLDVERSALQKILQIHNLLEDTRHPPGSRMLCVQQALALISEEDIPLHDRKVALLWVEVFHICEASFNENKFDKLLHDRKNFSFLLELSNINELSVSFTERAKVNFPSEPTTSILGKTKNDSALQVLLLDKTPQISQQKQLASYWNLLLKKLEDKSNGSDFVVLMTKVLEADSKLSEFLKVWVGIKEAHGKFFESKNTGIINPEVLEPMSVAQEAVEDASIADMGVADEKKEEEEKEKEENKGSEIDADVAVVTLIESATYQADLVSEEIRTLPVAPPPPEQQTTPQKSEHNYDSPLRTAALPTETQSPLEKWKKESIKDNEVLKVLEGMITNLEADEAAQKNTIVPIKLFLDDSDSEDNDGDVSGKHTIAYAARPVKPKKSNIGAVFGLEVFPDMDATPASVMNTQKKTTIMCDADAADDAIDRLVVEQPDALQLIKKYDATNTTDLASLAYEHKAEDNDLPPLPAILPIVDAGEDLAEGVPDGESYDKFLPTHSLFANRFIELLTQGAVGDLIELTLTWLKEAEIVGVRAQVFVAVSELEKLQKNTQLMPLEKAYEYLYAVLQAVVFAQRLKKSDIALVRPFFQDASATLMRLSQWVVENKPSVHANMLNKRDDFNRTWLVQLTHRDSTTVPSRDQRFLSGSELSTDAEKALEKLPFIWKQQYQSDYFEKNKKILDTQSQGKESLAKRRNLERILQERREVEARCANILEEILFKNQQTLTIEEQFLISQALSDHEAKNIYTPFYNAMQLLVVSLYDNKEGGVSLLGSDLAEGRAIEVRIRLYSQLKECLFNYDETNMKPIQQMIDRRLWKSIENIEVNIYVDYDENENNVDDTRSVTSSFSQATFRSSYTFKSSYTASSGISRSSLSKSSRKYEKATMSCVQFEAVWGALYNLKRPLKSREIKFILKRYDTVCSRINSNVTFISPKTQALISNSKQLLHKAFEGLDVLAKKSKSNSLFGLSKDNIKAGEDYKGYIGYICSDKNKVPALSAAYYCEYLKAKEKLFDCEASFLTNYKQSLNGASKISATDLSFYAKSLPPQEGKKASASLVAK